MDHKIRWTIEKIGQRIALIETLGYRRKKDLPPFRLHILADSKADSPLVSQEIDDRAWTIIEPYTYWGNWRSHFTLFATMSSA